MLLASPSCAWCPPSVCVVVPLNGGVWCVVLSLLSRVVPVLFMVSCSLLPFCVVLCLLWVGKCGGVCCLYSVCGIVLWRVQHCYRIVLCCCVVCGEEEGGV